jgi:AraC-like DNA-binding protein
MTTGQSTSAAPLVQRRTWDRPLSLHEGRTKLNGAFGPFQITAPASGGSEPIATLRYARLGPVVIADAIQSADVRVELAERRSTYSLVVPLNGQVQSRFAGTNIVLTSGNALMGRADGPVATWLSAGSRVVAVSFQVAHVHRALESQLGEQIVRRIPFVPVLNVATHSGAALVHMVLTLNELAKQDDSFLLNPLVGLPYVESLTQALLLTVEHPYSNMLGRQEGRVRPSAVRVAAELMETEPGRPLTVTELAAEAHVSLRALHDGFQREFGMPPMAYLRDIRLRRAHADLVAADPAVTTVASVARRWGFPHLGRFSARHAAAFGELPRATLRRSR